MGLNSSVMQADLFKDNWATTSGECRERGWTTVAKAMMKYLTQMTVPRWNIDPSFFQET